VAYRVNKEEIKARTKRFALAAIRLIDALPRTQAGQVIGRQLLRSATSVGANYRAACLARSRADFISKLGIVAEEADESQYWMELLMESRLAAGVDVDQLMSEAREIASIVIAARKTANKPRQTMLPTSDATASDQIRNRKS
jgi:four helix bundle protein